LKWHLVSKNMEGTHKFSMEGTHKFSMEGTHKFSMESTHKFSMESTHKFSIDMMALKQSYRMLLNIFLIITHNPI